MAPKASSRRRGSILAEHGITDSLSSRNGIVCASSNSTTTQLKSPKDSLMDLGPQVNFRPDATMGKRVVPIVDASNVARVSSEKAKLDRLVCLLNRFKQIALNPICIADANLWRLIDHGESYEKMVAARTVLQTPAGSCADTFIIGTAEQLSRKGVLPYLVTNDRKLAESATPARNVKFLFVPWEKEELLLFDPALEKLAEGVG